LSKNPGREFEADIQQSCKDQGCFFHRIKDVYIPPDLRTRIQITPNKYDFFIFKDILIPVELKSGEGKNFSLSESIIKSHQISSLLEAAQYDQIFPGLLFNFRSADNATYFVPIQEFVIYQKVIDGECDKVYKSKLNKSSIPIGIIDEIGLRLKTEKKRVHWRYDIIDLVEQIKEKLCKD
jgi:penicillin-binding protein-related factor A (putative recombinase)